MKSWKSTTCPCEIDAKGKILEEKYCPIHIGLSRQELNNQFGLSWQDWTLMTCKCKVEEIVAPSAEGREVLGIIGVHKKCPHHDSVPHEDLYETIYGDHEKGIFGESMLQAYTEGALLGKAGFDLGFHEPKRNKDGSDAGVGWKDGHTYKWEFRGTGKNRTLHIDVEQHETDNKKPFFKKSALTNQHKKTIKDACDGRFGKDRVFPL